MPEGYAERLSSREWLARTLHGVPDQTAEPPGRSHRGILLVLAGMIATGLLIWFVNPLHDAAAFAVRGDTEGLREQLNDLGAWGILVLYVVVLAHAVIPYPAEIINAAAGFVHGFWVALPMMMLAWVLSALLTYAMGKYAARPLLHRIAGKRRFETVERAILRGGAPVLLAARLLPIVPFSLTGYVCGAAGVPVWRFTWTTLVGFLPLTLIFILLGSRLEDLSLTDPTLYLTLIPVAALLLAAKPLARHLGTEEEEPAKRERV